MADFLPATPAGRERIGVDVDALVGRVPSRHDLDASLPAVRGLLDAHGIDRALLGSLRGGWFDARGGNDEVLAAAATDPRLVPVGTVDLRDALAAGRELPRLAGAGVRVLRLFCAEQGAEPASGRCGCAGRSSCWSRPGSPGPATPPRSASCSRWTVS